MDWLQYFLSFFKDLRDKIPVFLSNVLLSIDFIRANTEILGDISLLRSSLKTLVLKDIKDESAFDLIFDEYFIEKGLTFIESLRVPQKLPDNRDEIIEGINQQNKTDQVKRELRKRRMEKNKSPKQEDFNTLKEEFERVEEDLFDDERKDSTMENDREQEEIKENDKEQKDKIDSQRVVKPPETRKEEETAHGGDDLHREIKESKSIGKFNAENEKAKPSKEEETKAEKNIDDLFQDTLQVKQGEAFDNGHEGKQQEGGSKNTRGLENSIHSFEKRLDKYLKEQDLKDLSTDTLKKVNEIKENIEELKKTQEWRKKKEREQKIRDLQKKVRKKYPKNLQNPFLIDLMEFDERKASLYKNDFNTRINRNPDYRFEDFLETLKENLKEDLNDKDVKGLLDLILPEMYQSYKEAYLEYKKETLERLKESERKDIKGLMDKDLIDLSDAELDILKDRVREFLSQIKIKKSRLKQKYKKGEVDVKASVKNFMRMKKELVFEKRKLRKIKRLIILMDVSGSLDSSIPYFILILREFLEYLTKYEIYFFIDHSLNVTEYLKDMTRDQLLNLIPPSKDSVLWEEFYTRNHHYSHIGEGLETFYYGNYNYHIEGYKDICRSSDLVLIFSDARNNFKDYQGIDIIIKLREKCKKVYWLNPERESLWGTGDSIIYNYLPYLDCYSISSLSNFYAFLEDLLKNKPSSDLLYGSK